VAENTSIYLGKKEELRYFVLEKRKTNYLLLVKQKRAKSNKNYNRLDYTHFFHVSLQ
jgi:hypothetical protein